MVRRPRRGWIKKPSLTIYTGYSDMSNNQAYVIKPVNFAWWRLRYLTAYRHTTKAHFSFADGHGGTHTYEESGGCGVCGYSAMQIGYEPVGLLSPWIECVKVAGGSAA